MPIYEYVCAACGVECEVLQKMSDPPATECPKCGAEALQKEVSAPSFRLKGGGWYETDFKKDNQHHLAGSGPGESANSGDSASTTDKDESKAKSKEGGVADASTAKKSDDKSSGTSKKEPPAKATAKAASSNSAASA